MVPDQSEIPGQLRNRFERGPLEKVKRVGFRPCVGFFERDPARMDKTLDRAGGLCARRKVNPALFGIAVGLIGYFAFDRHLERQAAGPSLKAGGDRQF
jgi:hypothetical protein